MRAPLGKAESFQRDRYLIPGLFFDQHEFVHDSLASRPDLPSNIVVLHYVGRARR